jgi:hypothetical protein
MGVGRATKAAADAGLGLLSGLASLTSLWQGNWPLAVAAVLVLLLDLAPRAYAGMQATRTEGERARLDTELRRGSASCGSTTREPAPIPGHRPRSSRVPRERPGAEMIVRLCRQRLGATAPITRDTDLGVPGSSGRRDSRASSGERRVTDHAPDWTGSRT